MSNCGNANRGKARAERQVDRQRKSHQRGERLKSPKGTSKAKIRMPNNEGKSSPGSGSDGNSGVIIKGLDNVMPEGLKLSN